MLIERGEELAAIAELLGRDFFPETLEHVVSYSAQTDDTDGDEGVGILSVTFGPDGDAHVNIGFREQCRFRTYHGGGHHPKVRTALMILAEAMRLEQEEQ